MGAKYTFWHQLGLDFFRKDLIEEIAVKNTPFFIANAKNGIDEIKNNYKVSGSKLFCLPQYLSMNAEFHNRKKIKEELNINKDSVVIGMVSHYREEKLFDLLFETFLKMDESNSIHLIFLGDKTNSLDTKRKYDYFIEKIEALNLSYKISVLSEYPVAKVLSVLDIGVLVSTIEGTPNVVMEYMLYGLPVVATNHIGCEKLLNSNELLIRNNHKELAEKLKFLINNAEDRKRVGAFNANEIMKYSKENYFNDLTRILTTKSNR